MRDEVRERTRMEVARMREWVSLRRETMVGTMCWRRLSSVENWEICFYDVKGMQRREGAVLGWGGKPSSQ